MPEKITKFRGETITLATSVGYNQVKGIPAWANAVEISAPSATLENVSVAFGPKIVAVYFYDASRSDGERFVDITKEMIDRNTSTDTGGLLNSMTSSDLIYVGFNAMAGGLAVDVVATNNNAAVLTASRSTGAKDSPTWTATTITDNTSASSNTLNQDGAITWVVATNAANWRPVHVDLNRGEKSPQAYFMRFATDNTLDSSVSFAEMAALANTTLNAVNGTEEGFDYLLLRTNNSVVPPRRFVFDRDRFGAIEMKSASITSAANVDWLRLQDG